MWGIYIRVAEVDDPYKDGGSKPPPYTLSWFVDTLNTNLSYYTQKRRLEKASVIYSYFIGTIRNVYVYSLFGLS